MRVEEISHQDKVLQLLNEPFIKPTDFVTEAKLLHQFRELVSVLPTIDVDAKTLPLLVAKRNQLCALMLNQNPINIADIYIPKKEDETQMVLYRVDILAFQLMLAVTRLCDTGKYVELEPISFKDLSNMGLIGEEYAYQPFYTMSMQQIFDCFTTLQQSWKDITYTPDLPLFLDAIMLRISYLVCCEVDEAAFVGCGAYVDQIEGKYYPNRSFVFDVGWTFIEMYADLSVHHFFACTSKPPPFKFSKADRAWIKHQAKNIEQSENYQTKVMEIVLKHYCFPGEFERYIRDNKSERFSRTPRFKKIIGARGDEGKAYARTLMEVLNSKLPVELFQKSSNFSKTCRDEIMLLCLVHWVQRYVEVNFEETFVRTSIHCRLNYEQLGQLVKAQGYPVIIQTFNRYNVFYKDTLYTTNSVAKAFLLFFALIMRYHKGKILNTSLGPMNLDSRDMREFWEL